ncbi:MAG: hypothetical protein EZS28_034120, partial [Streblomastix strix]
EEGGNEEIDSIFFHSVEKDTDNTFMEQVIYTKTVILNFFEYVNDFDDDSDSDDSDSDED